MKGRQQVLVDDTSDRMQQTKRKKEKVSLVRDSWRSNGIRKDGKRAFATDSLAYLSVEGLMKAVRGDQKEFCAACFDGNYPTPLEALNDPEMGR